MGQMLLLHRPSSATRPAPMRAPLGRRPDPGATARGILLALALSSLAWIALALLVPRLF